MRADGVVVGACLIALGLYGVVWALVAKTHDDRWTGERSVERFRRFGFRSAPMPIERKDRIGGVVVGLLLAAGGMWVLIGYL